jgi:predicted Zn-dependent protease
LKFRRKPNPRKGRQSFHHLSKIKIINSKGGKMKKLRYFCFILSLLFIFSFSQAQEDIVMKAMSDELARSMAKLQLEKLEKPYFISYRVQESQHIRIVAGFGGLLQSSESRSRFLKVEVRVGSPSLDNTGFRSRSLVSGGMIPVIGGIIEMPLDDNYNELRRQIWLATDAVYKKALDDLTRKRSALQNKTLTEEIPDFSKEEPVTITDVIPAAKVNIVEIENLAKELSALFRQFPDVFTSTVLFTITNTHIRYINSEGSSFVHSLPLITFTALAATQANDGMPLESFTTFFGRSMDEFPGKDALASRLRELGTQFEKLRNAPLLDQYNGPVLFEGQAAAELFSQVLAQRFIATRRPVTDSPGMERVAAMQENPFLDKIGARVMPAFMNVIDNPTLSEYEGNRLIAGYKVDDEAVPARQTTLVENGTLKTLLTSRNPVRGILRSSGNYRVSGVLPSNLIVSAQNGLAAPELKDELLKLAKQRGKEYGIVIRRIGNPLLRMSRDLSSAAFAVSPGEEARVESIILAFKVFPDGHEELIRNLELTGMSTSLFKEIVAASKDSTVYNSPFRTQVVSFVMPSLLFEDISLKKPSGEIPKLPLIKHPFFDKQK